MRIIHFCGGRTWVGAKAGMPRVTTSIRASIGAFSDCSNSGLRASNHSRRLFLLRLRRKRSAASSKYGFTAMKEELEGVVRGNDEGSLTILAAYGPSGNGNACTEILLRAVQR